MSEIIIKENVLYNSNPELNKLAKAMFSLGEKNVGDTVYYFGTAFKVTQTNVKVYEKGRKYKHGIIAKNSQTRAEVVLTNLKEQSDFLSIWE
jgi:hypothetical protein